MATNVDAVPIVPDGARNAADLAARLEHNGMHIRTAKKLQSGRETRRAGADKQGGFRHENSRCLRSMATGLSGHALLPLVHLS